MQVTGLCRFSYPALGGFQIEHETIEDRIAYLYAEDRLEERFRLFETIALPCLREQTDDDFDLLIVIGDTLPAHHVDRLNDLTADVPQIRIIALPPHPQRQIMKHVLREARRDFDQPCIEFRHDDDDAVSVDFIERLRETARDCETMMDRHPVVAIDFNRGFLAELGPDGIRGSEVYQPFAVSGLGVRMKGGVHRSIMRFAHFRIPQYMPCVTFTDAPMWVRTYNSFNDSISKDKGRDGFTPLTPEQEGEFEARFAINCDQIRQVFAQPGGTL